MFYVYRITNKLNGKVYLGKAKDVVKRFHVHMKVAKGGKAKYPRKFHALHAAIAKYGIENFTLEVVHEVDSEQESFDLEVAEIASIRQNNLPCYNLSNGGEGNSGWHHTDAARQKMSKSHKGRKFSEEHKSALSEAQSGPLHSQYGKRQSVEWREGKSKLTVKAVSEIKSLLAQKISQRNIAKSYHVSDATISLIKHGKIWADVT